MSRRLLAHFPVATQATDMSVHNITTAAWTQLLASLPKACSAIEVSNNSGSTIQLSTGQPGFEGASILPYTVLPGGSPILLPFEIAHGLPISAKAVDQNSVTGFFTLNFFG